MPVFAGELVTRFFFLLQRAVRLLATALRRVLSAVAAIGVRAKCGLLCVLGLFHHLFALLHLRGEGGLGGCLCVCCGLLGGTNLGRVLRGGQIRQLQIRGTNRHDRVFPLVASVLLYFLYSRQQGQWRSWVDAANTSA